MTDSGSDPTPRTLRDEIARIIVEVVSRPSVSAPWGTLAADELLRRFDIRPHNEPAAEERGPFDEDGDRIIELLRETSSLERGVLVAYTWYDGPIWGVRFLEDHVPFDVDGHSLTTALELLAKSARDVGGDSPEEPKETQ